MTYINSDHLIDGANYIPTNKKGGTLEGPHFLVLHYTAGWSTEGDIQTLAHDDVPASAHGVLSREGTWTQIVPFNRVAWHAGPSRSHGYSGINQYGIGLEISNAGWIKETGDGYLDEYGNKIDRAGRFVNSKSNRTTASDPSTWLQQYHERLGAGQYRWEPFYEPQLAYLDMLIPELLAKYTTIKHIVTHEEIDTRGWKTDTGPAFPIKRYRRLMDDLEANARVFSVAIDELNMRSGPGTDHSVFKKLSKGTVVTEVDRDGFGHDWMHITANGVDGWVATRYLRQI